MDAKLHRLKREIQQQKAQLMQRATISATQMESLRRTVIVKLAQSSSTQQDQPTPVAAQSRKKSNRARAGDVTPSQEELEEIKSLMISDRIGPWDLVRDARAPEWGVSIVANRAFRNSARIEFTRSADMDAALAASKNGSIVVSSGQKVKFHAVLLRPSAVQEVEAAQRGEVRSGRLHDAQLALDKTIQRLEAAKLAMAELDREQTALVRNEHL